MQKTSSAFRPTLPDLLLGGLCAASALPLLVLAYLGTFTRYLADDYSTAGILVNQGFWSAQGYWYQNWSGRFSFTFLVSLVELAGVRIVPWLPLVGLLLWGGALFWTLRQLFAALGLGIGRLWTGILVNLLIFGVIKSFPAFAQVIFWQTGLLTYEVSLIFITLAAGLFLKRFCLSGGRPLAGWEYGAWFLAFLIGGGFSETWVIVQIALTGLALVSLALAGKFPLKKAALAVLLLAFLASWAALLIIAKSPGNNHRDTIMTELSVALLRTALLDAFWDLPRFLAEWLAGNTALALLLFLAGAAAGGFHPLPGRTARLPGLGVGLLLGAYLLLWAGFVPQYAVMGVRPAERAILMPMFLFLWMWLLLGIFTGLEAARRVPTAASPAVRGVLLVVLALGLVWLPLRTASVYFQLVPELRLYARLWDERDTALRAASARGERQVVVESLRRNPALHAIQATFWIEGDLQDPSDHWINQVAASYYGLASISLRR